MSPPCMVSACCCCYNAIDCDNIALLCKGKEEHCCFVRECNLDFNEESLGVGMTTNADNKECCKISLAICSVGLKTPDKCCASASRFLCCKSAASFPYDDQYMSKCACACYGLQCKSSCCLRWNLLKLDSDISLMPCFYIPYRCSRMRLLRPCRYRVPGFGPSYQGLCDCSSCPKNRTVSLRLLAASISIYCVSWRFCC
jgi:hypothetical protein